MSAFELLKSTIAEVSDLPPEDISPDSKLADINLVSLDYVSIQVAVKRKYGVQIDLEELPKQNLVTICDFANYIGALQPQ
jgi:acyl carrier protein